MRKLSSCELELSFLIFSIVLQFSYVQAALGLPKKPLRINCKQSNKLFVYLLQMAAPKVSGPDSRLVSGKMLALTVC